MDKIQDQSNMKRVVVEIPDELKRRAASKAALEGRTLKQVFTELLTAYVSTGTTTSTH